MLPTEAEITVEYPVVISNGERQTKIGTIDIYPSITFQKFQTILEQMIGVSYNNMTAYLVENSRPDIHYVFTSDVNFMHLLGDRNCYFLVKLKCSIRREYRWSKSSKRNGVGLYPELCEACNEAAREGVKPRFHLCIYDYVVERYFRTPAGPVSRPTMFW